MKDNLLNKAFEEAVHKASETKTLLPPDIMLLLYAFYKQATKENHIIPLEEIEENDLRRAFKYNAMIQVKGLSIKKAKQEYINTVNKYITD